MSDMYPTRLEQVTIGSTLQAPAALGRRDNSGGVQHVPVVFTPIRSGCSCHLIIPQGFVCLVNRHGKYVGMWDAGFYWAPPWLTVSHMIPTQYIVYDTPVKQCPTQDNVMVTIDVALVLRINTDKEEDVYNFCYQMGPRGLDDMLKAFQEEAIRGMARRRKYNEIYDLMDSKQDKQLDQTLRDLNNHFGKYGVTITEISVTNVHLPDEFAKTMQEATVWTNRNEFIKLKQEYDIAVIRTRELEEKAKQKAKEDLEKFTAEQDKILAELTKKKKLVDAKTGKILAEIRETEKADILEIETESKLSVAEINAKKSVQLAQIRSEGRAEAEKIKVETDTYVKTKKAFASKICAENQATCLKLQADAESFAAKQLVSRRTYEQKMRSLQTMRALANNDDVSIAGSSKDNVLAQLLANQKGGAVLGINP